MNRSKWDLVVLSAGLLSTIGSAAPVSAAPQAMVVRQAIAQAVAVVRFLNLSR